MYLSRLICPVSLWNNPQIAERLTTSSHRENVYGPIERQSFSKKQLRQIRTLPDLKGIEDLDVLQYFNGISTIPVCAFENDIELKTISIPQGVIKIEAKAFNGCTNLKSITIPDSVIIIAGGAFTGCNNLQEIILTGKSNFSIIDSIIYSSDVSSIVSFTNSNIENDIRIPQSVSTALPNVFDSISGLDHVSFPIKGIKHGDFVFHSANELINLAIPATFSNIDKSLIKQFPQGVESIYIPDSIDSIDIEELVQCSTLKRITVSSKNPAYSSLDGVLYNKLQSELICFPPNGSESHFCIPVHVNIVGARAFHGAKNLLTIGIPEAVHTIGEYAFAFCKQLQSISFPSSVKTLGCGVLMSCSNLKSCVFPNSIDRIPSFFVSGTGLKSFVIPETVKTIGSHAFSETHLTTITIPSSVELIEAYAFSSLYHMKEYLFLGEKAPTLQNSTLEFADNSQNDKYRTLSGVNGFSIFIPSGCTDNYSKAEHQKEWNYYKERIQEVIYTDDQGSFTIITTEEVEDAKRLNIKGVEYYNKGDYDNAYRCFLKSSNFGNNYATLNLAKCYYFGDGTDTDYEKAFSLFHKSSDSVPKSYHYLGLCYMYGRGTELNQTKAVEYFNKAIELGVSDSSYHLALCHLDGKGVTQDVSKAISILQECADSGKVAAMTQLAHIYSSKKYGVQNYSKSYEWYLKAYDAGSAFAPYYIALFYENGISVEKDLKQAESWYQKAMERNCPDITYLYGRFLIRYNLNTDKGAILLNDAVSNNDTKAMVFLGECLTEGNRIAVDFEKAFALFEKAVKLGDAESYAYLADAYYYGKGTDIDLDKAVELCLAGVDKQDNHAKYLLGQIYYWHFDVYGSIEEAIELTESAASNGYVPAQIQMGDWYGMGVGLENLNFQNYRGSDDSKRRYWYECAAKSGDARGEFALGDLYLTDPFYFTYTLDNFGDPVSDEIAEKNLSELGYRLIMSAETKALFDNRKDILSNVAHSLCWHYAERVNEQFEFSEEYQIERDARFEHGMFIFWKYLGINNIAFPDTRDKYLNHHLELSKKYNEILTNKTASWGKLSLRNSIKAIPYLYFVDYHPTTVSYTSDQIEKDRELIWRFKDGYSSAMHHVEKLIREKLEEQFQGLTRFLTLVCIPASSIVANNRRYREFSRLLCEDCEMINAFEEIKIVQEPDSAKHLGGSGSLILELNEEFFKGRNVIIFDDIVTSGKSISKMNNALAKLGANTIAAISIGKTTHSRPIDAIDVSEEEEDDNEEVFDEED